jgi:hypothetical protein
MQTEERAKSGPKTPEGKRRSSLNALKHGLRAESPHAVEKLTRELGYRPEHANSVAVEYFQPKDENEQELVRKITEYLTVFDKCRRMIKQKTARRPGRKSTKLLPATGNSGETTPTRLPDPSNDPDISLKALLKYHRTVELKLLRTVSTLQKMRKSER